MLQATSVPSGNLNIKKQTRFSKLPLKYKLRTLWLELCYRTRILSKAITNLGSSINYESKLYASVIKGCGKREDLGLIGNKVVTTAGVNYIVDAFQNTTELENMKYHASGTGSTAEAVGDTALITEVEATRATGTTTEGASANIYRTVGTISYTATRAIVEHGVFSAATTGTLLDRTVFSAINVTNGDSIEFTYELTFPAGS